MPDRVKEKLEVIAHLGDHITYKEDIGICYDSALAKVIEDAYMELKNGVTVQEWIPVTERLPEPKENPVLVYYANTVWAAWKHDNYWELIPGLNTTCVTHWMPMPKPPKGE